MSNPLKLIITSKKNLSLKYGKDVKILEADLAKLILSDKKKGLNTKVVYLDDPASMKIISVSAISAVNPANCKKAIDAIYKKLTPEYIVLLGAGDVIPFQELDNPTDDDDGAVNSDLPYACETAYSKNTRTFTGPSRVVGRIPDIHGKGDITYLQTLIANIIKHKPLPASNYANYFSVSAQVWTKSTQLSLQNIFGEHKDLLISPPERSKSGYTAKHFKPLIHFYNCHGASNDTRFYGQKRTKYPESLHFSNLSKKIAPGTVIAAECCYGAELIDHNLQDDPNNMSIANAYLLNNAISFLGSSTIAYGPADSQGLADLLTQYFIKSVLNGASAGRALLEARQKFLAVVGPQLDPYELKTLAQFYLLGDPSLHPVAQEKELISFGDTTKNNRMKMALKGANLKNQMAPSKKIEGNPRSKEPGKLQKLLKELNFTQADKKAVYKVEDKKVSGMQKSLSGGKAIFRSFMKHTNTKGVKRNHLQIEVLVVKEDENQILGYRTYVSR